MIQKLFIVKNAIKKKFIKMYYKKIIYITTIIALCLCANTVEAKTYYVSTSGSDSNQGTEASPWASPGYASRQLSTGTYYLSQYDDDIIIPPSGKKNNWVTIKGETGNRPVLAGSNNLMTAINIAGKNYVKLQNLEITSNNGAEFREAVSGVGEPMNHIRIKNLYIHHIDEFGIDLQDINDLVIDKTTIKYTGFGSIGGPEAAQGGWTNITIKNSRLSYSGHYYQGGNGPGPYDRPDGFGIEESEGPIKIIDTYATHNKGDGLDSKAANTLINRCYVANNFADGVKLWQGDSEIRNTVIFGRGDGDDITTPWSAIVIGSNDSTDKFVIKNVTVDDEVGNNHLASVQYDEPDVVVKLVMTNNIFSSRGANNSPVYIGESVQARINNNLFYFPNSNRIWKQ